MGWGQWMVPELRDSQLFALRALELELRDTIRRNPEKVIGLCVALSQQCQMQASIIRKATGRIAELEVGQAIATTVATQRRRWWRRIPGWRWWRRWVEIVRAVVQGQ